MHAWLGTSSPPPPRPGGVWTPYPRISQCRRLQTMGSPLTPAAACGKDRRRSLGGWPSEMRFPAMLRAPKRNQRCFAFTFPSFLPPFFPIRLLYRVRAEGTLMHRPSQGWLASFALGKGDPSLPRSPFALGDEGTESSGRRAPLRLLNGGSLMLFGGGCYRGIKSSLGWSARVCARPRAKKSWEE